MAKKTEQDKKVNIPAPTPQAITDTLELNYMPYTMSVIVSRAIPEIDGFKPAHRKILYTMYNMGLLRGERRKSADVVGQTMKVHPHGDMAIYETLVRLSRGNDALLHPFIDSKGNFGKQFSRDMSAAAPRYTEVKLDPICEELFEGLRENAVDMVDNYDGSMKEPTLFPTTFPNVLVTQNQGIAVGMASSVCGFNLKEVCDACIAYIKDADTDITRYISAPDFSTGGQCVYDETELKNVIETGRGSFKLRAKWRYDKKESCIEIYEIPYTATVETVLDKIAAMVKGGKLRDVTDARDETGINGLKIAVDIRRSSDPETVMKKLFANTPLMGSYSCNFNVLIDKRPKTLGVRQILGEWLKFRVKCVKRTVEFELNKNRERLHLLGGLQKIALDIDKAIRIIRGTEDDSQVAPNLCKGFNIDTTQAEFVAEIKLRNLNKDYLLKLVAEVENIKEQIRNGEEILSSDGKVYDIIIAELKRVTKKYSLPRRTEIVYALEETAEIKPHELIDDYACRLFMTREGYFKKITLVSLRSSGEQKVKDGDAIIQEYETSNKSEIMFFSDRQNVYKTKLYEIAESKAGGMGEFLQNMLGADEGEKFLYFAVPSADYSGYMFFAFENGKAAKVEMSGYATKTNRKKLVNAYTDKSPLIFAEYVPDGNEKDYLAVRDADKALLFNTALIPLAATKNTQGVQALTLKKGSRLSKVTGAHGAPIQEAEFYRADKIPSAGHFISGADKESLDLGGQVSLV